MGALPAVPVTAKQLSGKIYACLLGIFLLRSANVALCMHVPGGAQVLFVPDGSPT